jgi:FAD/FMN-containing dehydrogenase
VAGDISRIDALCRENSALKTSIANSDGERSRLWDIRESVSASSPKDSSKKFDEDLSVPRSKVRDVLEKVYELGKMHSLQMAAFGHIGEGHINVRCNNGEKDGVSVRSLVSQILKDVVPDGRAITPELAVHEIEIMKNLKKMFDLKGIMNPGKILW